MAGRSFDGAHGAHGAAGAFGGPPPGVLSVGYQGLTADGLLRLLTASGVTVLADVRLTPVSRTAGFGKRRLEAALAGAGIGYRHLPALGNPRENRPPFRRGGVAEGRTAYRRLLDSARAREQLDALVALAARERVAVLCFERDEEYCHRKVLCDLARTEHGLPVSRPCYPHD